MRCPEIAEMGLLAAMDPLFISGPKLGPSDKKPVATTTTCRPRGYGREGCTPFCNIRQKWDRCRVEAVAQELYSDAANCPPALLSRPRVALEI